MIQIRKHISFILAALLFVQSLPSLAFADSQSDYEEKYLIATAYYSPLPGQSYYLRGSYEADVRLNGNGTHGASGREVFPGMLAAPKTYEFGTKIYIEWVGTGSVEDRGGAIVPAGQRGYASDRIDIWMGSWEAGLKRALGWGKRKVFARVYEQKSVKAGIAFDLVEAKIGIKNTVVLATEKKEVTKDADSNDSEKLSVVGDESDELSSKIRTFQKKEKQLRQAVESIGIPKSGEVSQNVRTLQNLLSKLGYFDGKTTAIYGKQTADALAKFQLDHKLISDLNDQNAGKFGPMTRDAIVYEALFAGIESDDLVP